MTDKAAYRHGYVTADFLIDGYRISGEVRTTINPLADVLNDSLQSHLEIENVYVSPIQEPANITGHYTTGHLRKQNILMAVLHRAEDGLPRRQTFANPAEGATLPIFLTVSGFEVRGQLSSEVTEDLERLLVLTAERFIPIASAVATTIPAPAVTFQGGIILVNREYIGILCHTER